MERKTQTGLLLLADISGYTFFLASTELEHADTALGFLLETVIEKLSGKLKINKLEGDAVFAYVEDGQIHDCDEMMMVVDETYRAFRDKAIDLNLHRTCNCRACKAIPDLDLKFMVHHGDFIVQNIAGITDLLGSDVNLVHRLLKNQVSEATGWRGYALFTQTVMESLNGSKADYIQQCETYEHLGEVETFVVNLQPRYAANKRE